MIAESMTAVTSSHQVVLNNARISPISHLVDIEKDMAWVDVITKAANKSTPKNMILQFENGIASQIYNRLKATMYQLHSPLVEVVQQLKRHSEADIENEIYYGFLINELQLDEHGKVVVDKSTKAVTVERVRLLRFTQLEVERMKELDEKIGQGTLKKLAEVDETVMQQACDYFCLPQFKHVKRLISLAQAIFALEHNQPHFTYYVPKIDSLLKGVLSSGSPSILDEIAERVKAAS